MRVWGASLVVGDGDGHRDVAAGGVGVGADLVGNVADLFRTSEISTKVLKACFVKGSIRLHEGVI